MKKVVFTLFGMLAALVGMLVLFHREGTTNPVSSKSTNSAKPDQPAAQLTIYCAAGLKKPVEAVAAAYRRDYGTEVQIQFGGTGTLLSQIRVAKAGDLFIAADETSMADARKYDTVREMLPVVVQTPVIAVRDGNPKNIHGLADLLRDDVRVALANPEAASIGKITKAVLTNDWEKLATHAAVMKPTVTEIAGDLSLGAVDAAVLWDSTVPQFKGIIPVKVPELAARGEKAMCGVLTACTQPTRALHFARYLTAPEKGGGILKAQGFVLAGGDAWAEKPELIFYSGGVNRMAIESMLKDFADREGVNLTTVFNGCGILCASMKTMLDSSNPKLPDAYYACDLCFVPPVANLFPEAVMLTETDIGIVVRKDNPHQVKTMADLAQPGLRVGLCNAEQSTLGFMTRGMLKESGVLEAIHKNVSVEVPTADFLINQMRAGGLDAAIVYRVNVLPQAEHLEFIPIKHAGAKAVQPFSVREGSANRLLAGRLLQFLRDHREKFEQAGFLWRDNGSVVKSEEIVVPAWLKQK